MNVWAGCYFTVSPWPNDRSRVGFLDIPVTPPLFLLGQGCPAVVPFVGLSRRRIASFPSPTPRYVTPWPLSTAGAAPSGPPPPSLSPPAGAPFPALISSSSHPPPPPSPSTAPHPPPPPSPTLREIHVPLSWNTYEWRSHGLFFHALHAKIIFAVMIRIVRFPIPISFPVEMWCWKSTPVLSMCPTHGVFPLLEMRFFLYNSEGFRCVDYTHYRWVNSVCLIFSCFSYMHYI